MNENKRIPQGTYKILVIDWENKEIVLYKEKYNKYKEAKEKSINITKNLNKPTKIIKIK